MTDRCVDERVGVLGATSFVGASLLPMLIQTNWRVTAFSRRAPEKTSDAVNWQCLASPGTSLLRLAGCRENTTPFWICVAPIWVLPDYFALLETEGAKRVVALSSTSQFTKTDSSDPEEQALARRLVDAETRLRSWAESRGVEWVVLRPTLIYGGGADKNITEIARLIRRFGFFPLLGEAKGLRQPIQVEDVAAACVSALRSPGAANRAYNITGAETLSYREIVLRVFGAMGRNPRLLTVPLWVFCLAVRGLHCVPRYRKWSAAMAERMNRDMVFDHTEAANDLGFNPSAFALTADDVQE